LKFRFATFRPIFATLHFPSSRILHKHKDNLAIVGFHYLQIKKCHVYGVTIDGIWSGDQIYGAL
jgi:hypothetical protein